MAEPGGAGQGTEIENKVEIELMDDDDIDDHEKEEAPPAKPERDKWGSKVSYFLTLIGYAVGFGNIWRFPYQMRENGGLAFLIPYTIMLAIVGIPIFFLELAVGQRRRKGVVNAWNEISPLFGGLGLCTGWVCFFVGLYYNTLIAYCLSYFVDSFYSPLPWTSCKSEHLDKYEQDECRVAVGDRSTKYYWNKGVLGISTGILDAGSYNFVLMIYHIIAWGAVFAILYNGTKSVGAVVYVTALFPYVVLIAFLIANLFQEPAKAWLGAYRLLRPDWSFLINAETWLKAGSQIFFSLGLAEGCLVVFASYNPERNNCYRDSIYISLINCGTSLLAALVVFPIIGALGHRKYDECVEEMKTLFAQHGHVLPLFKDKYDIYFRTNATKWEELSTNNTLTVMYTSVELDDKTKNDYTREQGDEKWKSFTINNSSLIGPLNLRDCSIGKEATASGGGSGFVFIGFTEAVKNMKYSNFWSLAFFTMLITLGLDSGFGTVEGAVAALEDLTRWSRAKATTVVCGILTGLSLLLFPFGFGSYVLDLLDTYTANWTLLLVALAECIAVAWSYGLAKIAYDVRLMTGSKPNLYILVCWKYISPVVIIALLIGSIVTYIKEAVQVGDIKYTVFDPSKNESIDGNLKTKFPEGPLSTGFLLMLFCILWIPVQYFLRKTKYNIVRDEAPADFPEEELRSERQIFVEKEEDQFSETEKVVMGKQSLLDLQEQRDRDKDDLSLTKRKSGTYSFGSNL